MHSHDAGEKGVCYLLITIPIGLISLCILVLLGLLLGRLLYLATMSIYSQNLQNEPPNHQRNFRAPERADRRVVNHWPCPVCCVLGAPQTSPSRISAPALALESIGEDSSPTLSWLQFWPRESVGEDSSPTLSWPHFLTRGSWPHFLAS